MLGDYLVHRNSIRNTIVSSFFAEELFDNTLIINETNVTNPLTDLQKVTITGLPTVDLDCAEFSSNSIIVNLEGISLPFGQPNGAKSVEKALAIIRSTAINIILFEMKSGLSCSPNVKKAKSGIGATGIEKKIKDSISRLLLLFPVFTDNSCLLTKLNFYSVNFYNQDLITPDIAHPVNGPVIRAANLFKAFQASNTGGRHVQIQDYFGNFHNVHTLFVKNPSPAIEMNYDISGYISSNSI